MPRGADDERGGRGACLSRLMEAHGGAVADLFEGGEPFAGVVLRAAIAGALAAPPRPDFARLVEARRGAAAGDARRARRRRRVNQSGGRGRASSGELARLIWAAFLAGCGAAAPGAAGTAPGERRGRRVVERAVLGGCTSDLRMLCEPRADGVETTRVFQHTDVRRAQQGGAAGERVLRARTWGRGGIRRAAPRLDRAALPIDQPWPRGLALRGGSRSTASASRRRGPS